MRNPGARHRKSTYACWDLPRLDLEIDPRMWMSSSIERDYPSVRAGKHQYKLQQKNLRKIIICEIPWRFYARSCGSSRGVSRHVGLAMHYLTSYWDEGSFSSLDFSTNFSWCGWLTYFRQVDVGRFGDVPKFIRCRFHRRKVALIIFSLFDALCVLFQWWVDGWPLLSTVALTIMWSDVHITLEPWSLWVIVAINYSCIWPS